MNTNNWEDRFKELLANPNMIHFNAYEGEVALIMDFISSLLEQTKRETEENVLQIIDDLAYKTSFSFGEDVENICIDSYKAIKK